MVASIAAASVAASLSFTLAGAAQAGPTTGPAGDPIRVVSDADGSWVAQAYECFETGADLTPQQESATGPQRAPFGSSSHHIRINEYSSQTELYRTAEYDGTRLADLTTLAYSTYAKHQSTGPDRQPSYLRLNVDTDNDLMRDTSLFFIPANNADQQPIVNGEWQSWDVAGGHLSVDGDAGPAATVTLADFVAAHPDATLVNNADGTATGGALAVITGCGMGGNTDPQRNGNYYVDRVIVGSAGDTTLFDFGGSAETAGDTTQQVVDPEHTAPWYPRSRDWMSNVDLTTTQQYVDGPGQTPAGVGSLRFEISDDTNPNRFEQFRTPSLDGRLLRDVRDLGYSTYQQPFAGNATLQQPVYMWLAIDEDGDDAVDNRLFFIPANNGPILNGEWQTWDAANGNWNLNGDDGPTNSFTLGGYLAEHPDARIVNTADNTGVGGGWAFQAGAGGAGQTNGYYYIDNLVASTVDAATSTVVSGTEYDLEPTIPNPVVSISGGRVEESNDGTTLSFQVTLDQPTYKPVDVKYATFDGTAIAGSDYEKTQGTLTFAPGETSQPIEVPITGDLAFERNERFDVALASPSLGTTDEYDSARGVIVNDDTAVDLVARQARDRGMRVVVSTQQPAADSPVAIYRLVRGDDPTLLSSTLNADGRLRAVLDQHFRRGAHVRLVAQVETANGNYISEPVRTIIQ